MTTYWHLSQNHLNLLETCPPQFQKSYVQQLKSPLNLAQEETTQWGQLFHLFIQQYNLGLPIENILIEHEEFKNSVNSLITATKDILTSPDILHKKIEYQLNYNFNNYCFTAVYDLIMFYPSKVSIFDWKTYSAPKDKNKLINDWQTRLYLYILAEKLNYKPHQISFTYWFIKLPNKIETFTIKYNEKKHEKTKQDLIKILEKLEKLTDEYINNNIDFSHHNNCHDCPYKNEFLTLIKNPDLDHQIPYSLQQINSIKVLN